MFIYNGIQLIRLGTDNVLHSNQISQLLINSDGIWMCGAGAGLVRLTLNKIKVVSENHGLPDKVVRAHFSR